MDNCGKYKLTNTAKYDRQYSWMNIPTIFMNGAMDKRVPQ